MIVLKDKHGKVLGESLQFLLFDLQVGSEIVHTALNVQKIKEVVDAKPLMPVPDPRQLYLGLLDLRDKSIPVLNLSTALKMGSQKPEYKRIVICDLQSVLIGLPVYKTGRILACRSSHFLPPPPAITQAGHSLFSGIISYQDLRVPLFDLDGIIHDNGLGPDLALDEKSKPSFAGKTVLVVEDSRTIRMKLSKFFQDLGFKVITAENGQDGLEKIKENLVEIDLVFTDIEMPYCDGIAMIRQFRSEYPGVDKPVIFNSALSNSQLIRDVENEKLGDYVVKFDKELLLAKLQKNLVAA